MAIKKIAFIGLGAMGFPMSKRLCNAGFELSTSAFKGKSIERSKVLGEMGTRIEENFADAAKGVDLIITILPEDEQVKSVLLDKKFYEIVDDGAIILEMTSCSSQTVIDVSNEYMKKGVKVIDAPVSGGTSGAENGTLTILGSGDKEAFEKVRPVLDVLASNINYVGKVGAGKALKAINQMLAAVNMVAVSEAYSLAGKLGIDPEVMYEVIEKSSGSSYIFNRKFKKLAYKDFSGGFKLNLMRKDLRIAINAGDDIPLPLARLAYNFYLMAGSKENEELDFSVVGKIFE